MPPHAFSPYILILNSLALHGQITFFFYRRILAEYVVKSSAVLEKVGINEMWVPEPLQSN